MEDHKLAGIRKYVSRYVVPFYFDYENGGYEKLRNHFVNCATDNQRTIGLPKGSWVRAGFWENYKSDKATQAEMDIYSYFPSVFLDENATEEQAASNLGASFVYRASGKILELEYRRGETNIKFDCKDLGILLFRNGIGFIWYETEFKGGVSLAEYVGFQNDFKELARTHEDRFYRKTKCCRGKCMI